MVGLEVGRPKRLIDVVGERGISKLDERGNGEGLADEGNASRKLNKLQAAQHADTEDTIDAVSVSQLSHEYNIIRVTEGLNMRV
jgi:hypothetical protein